MKVPVKAENRKQIGVIGAGACGSEVRVLQKGWEERSQKEERFCFAEVWAELWKPLHTEQSRKEE